MTALLGLAIVVAASGAVCWFALKGAYRWARLHAPEPGTTADRLDIESLPYWADDAEIFRRIAAHEAARDKKENRPILGEPRKYVRDKEQN